MDAVASGERVVLTRNSVPIADIVPHRAKRKWIPGAELVVMLEELRLACEAEAEPDTTFASDIADAYVDDAEDPWTREPS